MARGATRPADPVKLALSRVALLAQQGVSPGRIQREVNAIVSEWGVTEEPAELREHVAAMREQIAEGVQDANTQIDDMDRSDAAALRQSQRSLAALVATQATLDAELTRASARSAA